MKRSGSVRVHRGAVVRASLVGCGGNARPVRFGGVYRRRHRRLRELSRRGVGAWEWSVGGFRYSVFGFRFSFWRAADGSLRVWVPAGSGGAAGWFDCGGSIARRGRCRQLVSREAAKPRRERHRSRGQWSVFVFRFSVWRAADGSLRVWVPAGSGGAAGWFDCGGSIAGKGRCRQLVSREAAKPRRERHRSRGQWADFGFRFGSWPRFFLGGGKYREDWVVCPLRYPSDIV